jgi:hypothetical protein
MKKKIFFYTLLILLILSSIIIFLSVKGYETKKFNGIIEKEVQKADQNIKIKFDKIKIKLDLKNLNLLLSTNNPIVAYHEINLPLKKLDIFFSFTSVLKSRIEIKKLNFTFNDFDLNKIKKLSVRSKPSNLKSFILNNVYNGTVKGDISLEFDENFKILDYKVTGSLEKVDLEFSKEIVINKTNFNFFVENEVIKLDSIFAFYKGIAINEGKINIERKKEIVVDGSIFLELKEDYNIINTFSKLKKNSLLSNFSEIKGKVINQFNLVLSKSLELKNYNYTIEANLNSFKFKPNKKIKNDFLKKDIKQVFFEKTKIKADLSKANKKRTVDVNGFYKTNNDDKFKEFKVQNSFNKNSLNFNLNLDFDNKINFDLINYYKNNNIIGNIEAEISVFKNKTVIKKILLKEKKNNILIKGLELNKNNSIKKLKKLAVKTYSNGKINNDFIIMYGKNIIINGNMFDSTNLIKKIDTKSENSSLANISKDIQVNFKDVLTKWSIPIKNFNLIGKIEKGKIVKLSSKSEFSENEFLDISLKKEFMSNKKILEIYSDIPRAILGEYDFFNGVNGGKLLLTNKFDKDLNETNIVIKNFKVKDVPTFAKLLTLADFGGISDLLSGDGISFEKLEINTINDGKVLKINEIFAVGPSISILIDGYIDKKTGLVSLRGTMVPAKDLNKLISKIPLLGDILIPKDIGEGLFGVSFKMKGVPGKIKTTVNPIKTLTPRFITKALEKRKKAN